MTALSPMERRWIVGCVALMVPGLVLGAREVFRPYV